MDDLTAPVPTAMHGTPLLQDKVFSKFDEEEEDEEVDGLDPHENEAGLSHS